MNLENNNSFWFKRSMNLMLLISFPAVLKFIEWAIGYEGQNVLLYFGLFSASFAPFVFSLFFNLKFLAKTAKSLDQTNGFYAFVSLLLLFFHVAFNYMWIFTEYIDSLYLLLVPITCVAGIYACVTEIEK